MNDYETMTWMTTEKRVAEDETMTLMKKISKEQKEQEEKLAREEE